MDKHIAASKIQMVWRSYACRPCSFCKKLTIARHTCKECREYMRSVEEANYLWRRGKGPTPKEILHYCNEYLCEGDCGVLDCGCIDVCRGRCGRRRRCYRDY